MKAKKLLKGDHNPAAVAVISRTYLKTNKRPRQAA